MAKHRQRAASLSENDRRSSRRYTIAAELEYRVLSQGEVMQHGRGQTLNLSNCGMLFTCEDELAVGSDIEIAVAWPALLNDAVALNLWVSGEVARSVGGLSAVRITGHEFCLRGRFRLAGRRFPARTPILRPAAASLSAMVSHSALI